MVRPHPTVLFVLYLISVPLTTHRALLSFLITPSTHATILPIQRPQPSSWKSSLMTQWHNLFIFLIPMSFHIYFSVDFIVNLYSVSHHFSLYLGILLALKLQKGPHCFNSGSYLSKQTYQVFLIIKLCIDWGTTSSYNKQTPKHDRPDIRDVTSLYYQSKWVIKE